MADSVKHREYGHKGSIAREMNKFTDHERGLMAYFYNIGATWAEIARVLDRDESEVEHHHSLLKTELPNVGRSVYKMGDDWAVYQREHGIPIPKIPGLTRKDSLNNTFSAGQVFDDPFVKIALKNKAEEEALKEAGRDFVKVTSKNKEKKDSANDNDGDGDDDDYVKINANNQGNGHETKPGPGKPGKKKKVIIVSSSSSEDSASDSEAEHLHQKGYIYEQVYKPQFPPMPTRAAKMPTPDKHWSAEDCEVLCMIEAKHEGLKWHHMQAEFFNITGRMVPVELMKIKMDGHP
jgi:hypothetical protein